MYYQTITLDLIHENHALHESLTQSRTLATTVRRTAEWLRDRHRNVTEQMRRSQPGSNEALLTSAAFEIALAELENAIARGQLPKSSEAA